MVVPTTTPPTGTEKYIVFAKSVSHERDTLEEAEWLARSLSRYGWVEVERWHVDDDPEEGPVWNNEVIWSSK